MSVGVFRDDETGAGPPAPRPSPAGDPDGGGDGGPTSPRPRPSTSFVVDFDDRPKAVDPQRIEALLSKSRARHRRVQSMSAGWRGPDVSPGPERRPPPPSSARPSRKALGYNSEGYFSSDQEDVMSKSDATPASASRAGLGLPLRRPHLPVVPPNAPTIADTSSPEMTPLTTPGSEAPRGGRESPSSTVSEAGTYTIEADNYTEEQKAKMNIDEAFRTEDFAEPIRRALDEMRRHAAEDTLRRELMLAESIPDRGRPERNERNVLEISCRHGSPTDADPPPERDDAAAERPADPPVDLGSFTSVTASGVLGAPARPAPRKPVRKAPPALSKSRVDSSEFVHRPPRDNLVVQNVTSEGFTPSEETAPERALVGRLSHLSLNRCQGDKSWIREWADSVKRHNADAGLPPISPRHSLPLKGIASPTKSVHSPCDSPTKIPSPVGTLIRQRAPVPDILTSTPDTESYLQNTQNAISSLQAKLQNAKSSPLANLDQTLFHDKFNPSKLPISQLNRSNSLNYRLYRKTGSAESSPLRHPGNYLVTGTHGMPASTRLLLSNLVASKSLDTADPNISPVNGSYYSPTQNNKYDKFNYSPSYDRYDDRFSKDLHSDSEGIIGKRAHMRHHSFDYRNMRDNFTSPDQFEDDFSNANMTQSLNLKSSSKNMFDDVGDRTRRTSMNNFVGQKHMIDQTLRNVLSPGNQRRNMKLRGDTYNNSHQSNKDFIHAQMQSQRLNSKDAQNSPIRRSSSFNIVNKNNNVYDNNIKNLLRSPIPRISSAGRSINLSKRQQDRMHKSEEFSRRHNTPEIDCMSEDSDNISTGGFLSDYDRNFRKSNANDLLVGARCNRAFALRRARLESPDARSPNINSNSPRCPETPEMKRKFGNDQVKRNPRAPTRDSRSMGRISDVRPDVCQVADTSKSQKNKKISDTLKQSIANRLTRSSSTAKDFAAKPNEKNSQKKPVKGNFAISTKDVEFSNWKKRTSYDPMKAAQEAKKKMLLEKTKVADLPSSCVRTNEIITSPNQTSPVHRSRSFNCSKTPIDERLYILQQLQNDASYDTDDCEDRLICTLPNEGTNNTPILKMVSGLEADSELVSKLANAPDVTKRTKTGAQNSQVKLSTDYVTKLQINNLDSKKPSLLDKRRTYLIDADPRQVEFDSLLEADKRRTFILDSDTTTNSTTNGSGSRRNSSVFSDEKANFEKPSDSDVESDTEPIINVVPRVKSRSVPPQQRHSGDFSMSSSTCSASKDVKEASSKKPIQPRYLDISRFKNDSSTNKNFLRRDPSKTYVGVLPVQDHRHQAKKNAARQNEQEQKKQELEKWKRRASYDPRKAASQGKPKPTGTKSPSNSVLRSQSFHGPMMQSTKLTIIPVEKKNAESFYQEISSDNEF